MEGAWGGAGHRHPWERTWGGAAMGGARVGADRRGRELRAARPWESSGRSRQGGGGHARRPAREGLRGRRAARGLGAASGEGLSGRHEGEKGGGGQKLGKHVLTSFSACSVK